VSVLKELRNLMKNVPSSALLLFLAVSPVASQDEARSVPGLRASERSAVYAKVLLPVKAPAEGDHPAVESWIARKLRKRGATEFRAVTGWVRLAEKGELQGAGERPVSAEQMELARLRAELARVKMERDILKKATAYFAKESL